MVKATLLFHDKAVYDDGAVIEMRIWRLPQTSKERPHSLKYSLYYGRDGERVVGYDNESGKGDHRHYLAREEEYVFISVEQLVADFLADIKGERGE